MYTQRLLGASIPTIHDLQAQQSFRSQPLVSSISSFTSHATSSARPYDGRTELAPNMVITVEPGIYFSRYALQNVYLKDPRHSKYINVSLLERYYPVGGVRIEDDILVTETGYENLTTAPKGEEACRIIRGEVDVYGQPRKTVEMKWKEARDL